MYDASWMSAGVNRGIWGLGCTVCAEYAATGRKLENARFSKIATFQLRPTSGFHARYVIERHHASEAHRVASGAKRKLPETSSVAPRPQPLADATVCPTERPVVISAEDAAILKGNVPSPAEWVDAWAVLSETVSLRKGGRISEKTLGTPGVRHRKRKRYRQQLQVMAEVMRRKIRKVLLHATSISLALDECKYRKVIRFRADLPDRKRRGAGSLWRFVGASGFCLSGVLGLLDCSKKHASDFEEDHAVTAVKQLSDFLAKFCTPRGRIRGRRGAQLLACDHELKAHVMNTVKCVAADGASKERRAVFLALRDLFPNVLIVIRDPAHAIRIASKALHCDDVFKQVWEDLFDGKHSLVPDLMNSSKWHNLLVAIQGDNIRAVRRPGVPQPLAEVLRNVGFAKQRFDSTSGPVVKIALMILPVATLLAHIASDMRHERPQRECATVLLRKLDTKFCTAIGVSADWGVICNWFLRLFDVAGHDIAKSRSEIDSMIETLDAVFLEGCCFKRLLDPATAAVSAASVVAGDLLPPIHNAVSDAGREAAFITSKVLRNLRKKFVFYSGGMPVLLWGEPPEAHKEELLHRVQNVACLAKGRLLADFPRDDVRSCLAVFDRRLVRKGFGPLPDRGVRLFLLRGLRKLADLLGREVVALSLQYNGVLPYMLQQMEPSQPLAEKTNQEAWALLLDDAEWEAACPKRLRAASHVLSRLIRFYISIEDGECTVERDLGEFREHTLVHRTSHMEFLDDTLLMKLNGPRTVSEFDEGTVDSRVELTPFSRECSSLWRIFWALALAIIMRRPPRQRS